MKHKLRNSVEVIGYDKQCPKCNQKLQVRTHKYLTEKQKRAPFFYEKWYACINHDCYYQLNLEEDKVFNKNDMATYLKSKEQESNLLDLMRNF